MRREDLERAVGFFPLLADQLRETTEVERQYLERCLDDQPSEFVLIGWKVGSA
jgi:hypothetical protein